MMNIPSPKVQDKGKNLEVVGVIVVDTVLLSFEPLNESPEKHIYAWDQLPCLNTVHVFDSKCKGTDNSDMLSGMLTLVKEEVTLVTGSMVAACVRV